MTTSACSDGSKSNGVCETFQDMFHVLITYRVAISDFGVVLATSGIARRSIFGRVLANWASLVQSCPVLPHIDPG